MCTCVLYADSPLLYIFYLCRLLCLQRGPVGISGSDSEGQNAGPVVSWLNCCWQCTAGEREHRH
jgi:hypothetical protein